MLKVSPEELPALELAVVTAAHSHEKRSFRSEGAYTRVFNLADFTSKYDDLTVKYTDYDVIVHECETLRVDVVSSLKLQEVFGRKWKPYVSCLAVNDSGDDAPRVPQVVHYFQQDSNSMGYIGYIVMERIRVREVSEDELIRSTAKAVRWLHAQKMDFFGNLGGGKAFHTVFQRMQAPVPFTSLSAAQIYLNVAIDRTQLRRGKWGISTSPIDVSSDDLVLTQSDMNPGNFGVALVDGRPVLFDAAMIQALPTTFAYFTLLRTSAFARDVAAHIFTDDEKAKLLASPMFASLAEARNRLQWGRVSFGVDKDGNVKADRRNRVQA